MILKIKVIQQFKRLILKSDKTINIPLKIKKGSDAGYTIRVDNKIVADKDVSYDG